MPGRDEHASEHWAGKPQRLLGGAALALSAVARALEAESDRLSLWIPVLFGSGILAGRGTGFGLIIGGRLRLPQASPMPSSTPRWPARPYSPRRCAG
jgi:hypothetical protein